MGVGTFISAGRSLETALQRVERAESLGYESVYTTHIAGRDSLIVLAAYATRTERIKLGTGVLPIYSRTPVATAQAAATIDELSGGRMVLGLGVAHQVTVENWFGTTIGKPVAEMREYVSAIRAMFRGEDPPQGEKFPTRFRFMGYEPRPDLPVYIAALSPAMLRLAGQMGDGVMLWLCNPDYIRDVVVPEVTKGRERAGKTLDGFDIVAAVPAAVTEDPDTARASLRSDLIPYFSLPFYRAMIERSGYGDEIGAFDEAMKRGDTEAAAAAISNRFLEQLAAVGSAAEAEAAVRRYLEAGTTSPCLGGVPRTDFDVTLKALAGLSVQLR
ncbi:MAG TPA: LLM class flavin-dependent oxidoreductase [Thermoleophilaceae bacterium]|nr:LLM class flavin-dependent oxidoreductase [Thermoleophilaceae bacterium]